MARRVLIVASGLKGVVGHNFTYTRAVESALRHAGFEVAVWGHKHMPPALARELGYDPVFSHGSYDFAPGNGPWADLLYLYAQSLIYAHELRSRAGGRSWDLVFCHTVGDMELVGWNRFVAGARFDGRLAIVQRTTPGFSTQSRLKLRFHPYWRIRPRYLVALRRRLAERFTLLTDSEPLSIDYSSVYRHPVASLPIPLDETLLEAAAATPPRPGGPPRVGYLGDSRDGKGFELLPALIQTRLAGAGSEVFVVQCACNDFATSASPALAAMEDLAARVPSRVRLVSGVLSTEEYLSLLASLDLVLLPYTHPFFREGTSNVFAESMAFAKPVLVPAGTWMAAELARSGAGLSYEPGDPGALADRLGQLLAERATHVERATAFAPEWRRQHNAAALVTRLLDACGLAGEKRG